ncbi:MAG: mechanosensitive ion channel domain-containing protein [Planctomycetota bacterium]|jgi:small-conductance mechanosensitive channel
MIATVSSWISKYSWGNLDPWPKTLVVVVGALVVYFVVRKLLIGRLERIAAATDNDVDDRLVHFFRVFFGVVVFFVALLLIFKIHDVKLTPWLAGAGIAGIAIGLAARETLADVLSGVFLIADRPMRVGDRVKIERIGRDWGGWGDVLDIGLRRTKVRNTDGVIVNYPNNVLANSVITNFSDQDTPMRVRVRFQVGYDADLAEAMEVAEAAIARTDGVLPGTVEVVVRSLWDDSRGHLTAGALVEGRYRIEDVRERTRARSRVLTNLLADLQAAGVPLPRVRVDAATP